MRDRVESVEWAIHNCNKSLASIQANELLTDEIKTKQIESHQSYLRSLFVILRNLNEQMDMAGRRLNMIDSVLNGVRVKIVFHAHSEEWVVRLESSKGDFAVCGCPGELEANLVARAIASVIAIADTSFSEVNEQGKPMYVMLENTVEYDSMKDVANSAIESILAFMK